MVEFIKKDLLAKETTLGDIFKQKRQIQAFSLERIAKKLGIKVEYLRALEKNEFHKLPGGLYVRKFAQEYGAYLKIDKKDILKKLEQSFPANKQITNDYFSHKKISNKKLLIFPKIVRNLLIIAVVLACLLYLSLYFQNLIAPPNLEIDYPPQSLSTTENVITVRGQTEKETQITINDQSILSDESGHFEKTVNLKQGLNTIIIKAKKRYSQENVQSRQILVQ